MDNPTSYPTTASQTLVFLGNNIHELHGQGLDSEPFVLGPSPLPLFHGGCLEGLVEGGSSGRRCDDNNHGSSSNSDYSGDYQYEDGNDHLAAPYTLRGDAHCPVYDPASDCVYFMEGHALLRLSPAGAVTSVAGRRGLPGESDGRGGEARFGEVVALAADPRGGVLYVAEKDRIRRVDLPSPWRRSAAADGETRCAANGGVGLGVGGMGHDSAAAVVTTIPGTSPPPPPPLPLHQRPGGRAHPHLQPYQQGQHGWTALAFDAVTGSLLAATPTAVFRLRGEMLAAAAPTSLTAVEGASKSRSESIPAGDYTAAAAAAAAAPDASPAGRRLPQLIVGEATAQFLPQGGGAQPADPDRPVTEGPRLKAVCGMVCAGSRLYLIDGNVLRKLEFTKEATRTKYGSESEVVGAATSTFSVGVGPQRNQSRHRKAAGCEDAAAPDAGSACTFMETSLPVGDWVAGQRHMALLPSGCLALAGYGPAIHMLGATFAAPPPSACCSHAHVHAGTDVCGGPVGGGGAEEAAWAEGLARHLRVELPPPPPSVPSAAPSPGERSRTGVDAVPTPVCSSRDRLGSSPGCGDGGRAFVDPVDPALGPSTPSALPVAEPSVLSALSGVVVVVRVGTGDGQQAFVAHRSLLAAHSAYFAALFSGRYADSGQLETRLPDADPAAFALLLQHMYACCDADGDGYHEAEAQAATAEALARRLPAALLRPTAALAERLLLRPVVCRSLQAGVAAAASPASLLADLAWADENGMGWLAARLRAACMAQRRQVAAAPGAAAAAAALAAASPGLAAELLVALAAT